MGCRGGWASGDRATFGTCAGDGPGVAAGGAEFFREGRHGQPLACEDSHTRKVQRELVVLWLLLKGAHRTAAGGVGDTTVMELGGQGAAGLDVGGAGGARGVRARSPVEVWSGGRGSGLSARSVAGRAWVCARAWLSCPSAQPARECALGHVLPGRARTAQRVGGECAVGQLGGGTPERRRAGGVPVDHPPGEIPRCGG